MVDTYTPLDRYNIQAAGSNPNTWGLEINQVLALVEQNTDGLQTIDFGTAVPGSTITATVNNGLTDQARTQISIFTGTPTSICTFTLPALSWRRTFMNLTGQSVIITTSISTATVTLVDGTAASLFCDGTNVYDTVTAGTGTNTPSGMIQPFAGSVIPSGFLLCDGSAVSRTTYDTLFSTIGTTWGIGNGSSTFNLPDLRDAVLIGTSPGTLDANRPSVRTLGQSGGAETTTLITSQIPAHLHAVTDPGHTHTTSGLTHSHGVSDPTHSHGYFDPGHQHPLWDIGATSIAGVSGIVHYNTDQNQGLAYTQAAGINISIAASGTGISIQNALGGTYTSSSNTTGVTTTNTGGGGSHTNVQPYAVIQYVIKT